VADTTPGPSEPRPTEGPVRPTATVTPPARPLSRRERVWLIVHRGLDRWLSPLGVWVYRRTRGDIARPWKVDALLLTTRGRRSGRERTVVLQYFPDGDAMIVAAANDGGVTNPGWYHNLTADPSARVETMGRAFGVRAAELDEPAAADWWARIVRHDPSYERYARATRRRIPIVRLVPDGSRGR
jgi:deazaflavin-dependent oxidoreductase (nitroreductase family)